MPHIDNLFLVSCGLGELPAPLRERLVAVLREELEARVGRRLVQGLSTEFLEEFERIVDLDRPTIVGWIATHAPGFEDDELFQQVREKNPGRTRLAILGEYAGTAWLSIHRPDYRDVVKAEMNRIREAARSVPDSLIARAA